MALTSAGATAATIWLSASSVHCAALHQDTASGKIRKVDILSKRSQHSRQQPPAAYRNIQSVERKSGKARQKDSSSLCYTDTSLVQCRSTAHRQSKGDGENWLLSGDALPRMLPQHCNERRPAGICSLPLDTMSGSEWPKNADVVSSISRI